MDGLALDLAGLLLLPALVALNGLFVAAEFALVAVRKTQIEELVRQGRKGARHAEAAINRLDRSIAATQLGITLASIGLGWLGEPALADLLRPVFSAIPGDWGIVAVHSAATVVAFLLITFMHVTFGELIPKNIALQTPTRVALWLSTPLVMFARATRPLTLLMILAANVVLRLFGSEPSHGHEMVHS